jgi:alanine racemase
MSNDQNNHQGIRTWLEIDKSLLKNNVEQFRRIIKKDCMLMAITKSNAYGHGLIDYSLTLDKIGVDWFGVDSIVEAKKLRDQGISKPILVLGYTLPEYYREAALRNISVSISNLESLKSIRDLNLDCKLNIHIKIDSGMHRQGFMGDEIGQVISILKKSKDCYLQGIYTHFASAKNPAFRKDTEDQIKIFNDIFETFKNSGFSPLKHAAATGGTIVFPESHFDMVRVGIGLMGIWPSAETRSAYEDSINLKPILSWKTIISEIKNIKKGERIGYGLTELLRRDTKVAILPVGYWHGYKWALSSVGNVLINGQRCRVLGRVSMDMITIDVTDIKNVRIGDEVFLLGSSRNETVSAEELALLSNSYNYEIITQLNPLMKRIYK